MQNKLTKNNNNKNIALVAQVNMQDKLSAWAIRYKQPLRQHHFVTVDTVECIFRRHSILPIEKCTSDPRGDNLQIDARFSGSDIDMPAVFFAISSIPRPNISVFRESAGLWNISIARSGTPSDFIVSY